MDVVRWCGFSFYIEKHRIIAVKDINITMSVETENKAASGENYVRKKNLNPTEVTMTGIFSAALGVKDVQTAAMNLAGLCRSAESDYVYIGNSKLMPPKFMGVSAKISNIEITPKGVWSYCEVQITLKQCEKYGGGTAGSSSSGKKKKKKKGGSPKQPQKYPADNERKKQMEQAKERAKQVAAEKKQGGYTPTRYGQGRTTGGGGGKRVAMTR